MSLDPMPSLDDVLRIKAEREGRHANGGIYRMPPMHVPQSAPPPRVRKTRGRGISAPTEHQEQRALFEWVDTIQRAKHPEFGFIYAVPNGTYTTPAAAGKAKAEGVRAGYPDIGWDLQRGRYVGFRGELKRRDKGTVSPLQQEWHVWLERQGLYVVTCHGWAAMREELLAYFALANSP